ncbi:Tryptophan synthase alpha chain [hydrothermal vent metagenome]|uniref:tryptophan synthase n=1 Tax=hydrothermal vent metagenome TaxID=652676 RepID=A0A3B1BDB0_9ZZZZ
MGRITNCFDRLKIEGRKALVPYVTAGDPEPAITVPLMHAMVEAGADIVELGVPFSDPMADGPVIQRAAERALEHGTSLRDVLAMVAEFRRQDADTPVVLMGYLNPVEVMGYGTFAKAAAEAGVDGVISVDLPPEEAHELSTALRDQGIDPIFLLAPTTDDRRIEKICAAASGYVYYVALKGVTGASSLDVQSVTDKLAQIGRHTGLPVAVGFGIKDAASAAAVANVADAVVVGSVLVEKVEQNVAQSDRITREITDVITRMRAAMDV